jgi:hypothetical protein
LTGALDEDDGVAGGDDLLWAVEGPAGLARRGLVFRVSW